MELEALRKDMVAAMKGCSLFPDFSSEEGGNR